MDIVKLRILIEGDASGAKKATGEASSAISKMSSGAKGVGGLITGVIGQVTDFAAKTLKIGAAAAVGLATSLVYVGTGYNNLEQGARAAMTTTLGTAEAANKMMDDLREFGKSSPFPRQAFIKGTQQLLGFGYEAKKIVPTMDAIQNAVAAAGGGGADIEEIVNVLAKVTGTGKITAMTLNELGIRGIDAATLIGKGMGKTGNEIREAITEGTLDAGEAVDVLVEQMGKRFDGAAAGVKNTWAGAVDRIKGAWRDIGGDLVAPFIDPKGGGAAVGWANQFADTLRHIQAAVVPAVAGAMKTGASAAQPFIDRMVEWMLQLDEGHVTRFFTKVTTGFKQAYTFGQQAVQVARDFLDSGRVTRFKDAANEALGTLREFFSRERIDAFVGGVRDAVDWVANLVGATVGSTKDTTFERITSIVSQLAETAREAWPHIVQIGQSFAEASAKVGVSTWELLLAVLDNVAIIADAVLIPALELTANLMRDNQGAVQALVAAFALWKIAKASSQVFALSRSLFDAGKKAWEFGSAAASIPGAIKSMAATQGVSTMTAFRQVLGSSIRETKTFQTALAVKNGVTAFVSGIGNMIKATATWVASTARAAASYLAQQAKVIASTVAGYARMAVAAAANAARVVAGWVLMGVQALAGAAKVAAAWLISMGPIALVVAAVIGIVALIVKNWDTIKSVTGAVFGWVWDRVKQVFGFIKDLFLNFTGPGLIIKHWDTIKVATGRAWDWVKGRVSGVIDFLTGLPGRVRDAFRTLADIITAPFRAAFNAVADFWNRGPGRLSFSAPSWVPGIGGKGFSMPKIPKLAAGGLVPAVPGGILANIGEGRHDELVAPLTDRVFTQLADGIAAHLPAQTGSGRTVQYSPTYDISVTGAENGTDLERKLRDLFEEHDRELFAALGAR